MERIEEGGVVVVDDGVWPSVDGVLGLKRDAVLKQARTYFIFGFFLLPWLWFTNCFYFWPILSNRRAQPQEARKYLLLSAAGFVVYSTVILSWALTFAIGKQRVFGELWKKLCVYAIADSYY